MLNIAGYSSLTAQFPAYGSASSNPIGYAFFDVDGVYISGGYYRASSGAAFVWDTIPIPHNAVTFKCSIASSGAPSNLQYTFENLILHTEYNNALIWIENNKNLSEQVDDNTERIAALEESGSIGKIGISLPTEIDAVVNDKLQLFIKGFIKAINPYNQDIIIIGSEGKQYDRYWEYTPKSAANLELNVIVRDNVKNIISQKNSMIIAKQAPVSNNAQKNILCVGASITGHGVWTSELYRRLTSVGGSPAGLGLQNISMVGRRSVLDIKLEATGGWTWSNYIGRGSKAVRCDVSGVDVIDVDNQYRIIDPVNGNINLYVAEINLTNNAGNIRFTYSPNDSVKPSPTITAGLLTKISGNGPATISFENLAIETFQPFWDDINNEFTFIPYANTYCDGNIDVLIAHIGVNSAYYENTTVATVLNQVRTFCDRFLSEFPNSSMIIPGMAVPAVLRPQSLAVSLNVNQYGTMLKFLELNEGYEALTKESAYVDKIFYAPVAAEFDSEHGYPTVERAVNSRSNITETVGANWVHPNQEDGYQIADSIYRTFVCRVLGAM